MFSNLCTGVIGSAVLLALVIILVIVLFKYYRITCSRQQKLPIYRHSYMRALNAEHV